MAWMVFYVSDAVRRRRQECVSSPPRWGGGELRGSKNRMYSVRKFSNRRPRSARLLPKTVPVAKGVDGRRWASGMAKERRYVAAVIRVAT